MDDQIWFAASVALKTFVQFQFRFQSLTSQSLTGKLGFNLVKCCSQISQRKRPFHPFDATKTQGPQMEKFTKNHQKVTPKSPPKIFPSVHAPPWSSLAQCWNRSYKQLVLRWLCSMWCDFLWDLQIALNCYVVCNLFVVEKLWCCSWFNVSRPTQFLHFWSNVLPMINADMLWTAATSQHLMSFWQVIGVSGLQAPLMLSGYRPPFHQPENGLNVFCV